MKIWLLYVLGVFLLSVTFFRSAKIIPECEVASGQILYTVEVATHQAISTGYRIFIQAKPPSNSSEASSLLVQEGRTTKSARRRVRESQKVATVDSRTTVERSTVVKQNSPFVYKEELLNPYIIESIIKQSDRTYYFSEKSLAKGGVTVELISATPRKDDYFLKFRIVNAGKEHFIPQAFAVKHGSEWVDIQKFFPKYLVEAGAGVIGYLQVKTPYGNKERLFQLNESGGLFRKYSIFY